MKRRIECQTCGGAGHHGSDGEGGYFSCYACGETGWQPDDEPEPEPDEAADFDPAYADRAAADWWADRTSGP